jgi:outer membrane receptor for ferrienterochelin and colicins
MLGLHPMFHQRQRIATSPGHDGSSPRGTWRQGAVLGACLLAMAPMASAQVSDEDELALSYGDRTFVSIATGSRQPVSRAPAVATVITAQDIAAMGATDLDQVLESVPGLHVARETQGFAPVYVIRGINLGFNPQVLVLLNGLPLNTVYTGNRGGAWGGMPLGHVERIEVIRGPGSALYGADAFAGVINVIQKAAGDLPASQVGVRAGSFNTGDAWVSHVGGWGALDVSAYLRLGTTDGARRLVEADAQTLFDGGQATPVSLAPGPMSLGRDYVDASLELARDQWRWRTAYRLRDKLGLGTGVASALDPTGYGMGESVSTDLTFDDPHWREDWSLSAQASILHYKELSRLTLYPAGAFGGTFPDGVIGNPDKWERHGRLSVSTIYSGWAQHRLRLGVGLEHEAVYRTRETKNFQMVMVDGVPQVQPRAGSLVDLVDVTDGEPFLRPHGRSNRYVFVQDEWNFYRDWTLTAGWRRDSYSDFGGTSNPRVALVWEAAYNLTAKVLYGRAFRAPSMSELYAINNPVAIGNPDLLPEKIETLEGALIWQPQPGLRLGMNVFEYHMSHMIELVNTVYQNTAGQRGHGLELEAAWDVCPTLRLSGNFSHQRSIESQSGRLAANAPERHLYVRGDWRFTPGWSVHPQVNWVSERPRALGDVRAPLKGYATTDLTLQVRPTASRWQVGMSVHNLFDVDAREPSPGGEITFLPNDFPLPGRSVTVQATYQF